MLIYNLYLVILAIVFPLIKNNYIKVLYSIYPNLAINLLLLYFIFISKFLPKSIDSR